MKLVIVLTLLSVATFVSAVDPRTPEISASSTATSMASSSSAPQSMMTAARSVNSVTDPPNLRISLKA